MKVHYKINKLNQKKEKFAFIVSFSFFCNIVKKTIMNKQINLTHFNEKGALAIKPLVDSKSTSIGLENYGMVVFPQTKQSEPMIFKIVGDKRVYVNGLDEFADSVQSLSDEKQKKAKIKMIRETVAYLEKMVNYQELNVNDENFWSKVKTFRPDNKDYFSKIKLEYGNDDKILKPLENIEDLVIYHAVMGGGFSMCGTDIENCRKKGLKWYMSIERDIEEVEVATVRSKNKAIVALEELYNKSNDQLFYVVKTLIPDATKFKRSSSKESMYSFLDDFLNGKKNVKLISTAVEQFNKVLKYSMDELMIRAMIADCNTYKIFVFQNNVIMNRLNSKVLGTNTEEVVQYFLNPLHTEEQVQVYEELKNKYW